MIVKQLIIAIKHGCTTKECMEKFHFSSEEDFFNVIKKMASVRYEEFIRQLKRNDKRALKNVIENADTEENINMFNTDVDDEVIDIENSETPQVSELEKLQNDEIQFSNILLELEGEHKSLVHKRKEIADSLQETKNELQELIKKVEEYENAVTEKWLQYNAIGTQMSDLDTEMSEYRTLLENVRSRITELKQVTILVTANNIEVENGELPDTNCNDVQANFESLLKKEEAEELTVRELKTLAQLLSIINSFESYEVIFENTKMENLFNEFKVTA